MTARRRGGTRRATRTALAVVAACACACAGCQNASGPSPAGASSAAPSAAAQGFVWTGLAGAPSAAPMEGAAYVGPYEQAVAVAARLGLEVWVEADLAKRWRAGPDAFRIGIDRLGELARDPHVVGFKIADELAYQDGFDKDPAAVRAFLRDTRQSLAAVAPGRKILVDFAVPVLGCAAGLDLGPSALACLGDSQARYPALSLSAMDSYVSSGDIDVLSLSTFLQTPTTYTYWGTSIEAAQTDAWNVVRQRGWGDLVELQARKALAHAGGYSGTTADAADALGLYLDIPLREGASSAHVWAWRQFYQGHVVSLVDDSLAPNALWDALVARRASGIRMDTTFSPRQVARGLRADLRVIAEAFTGIFIAAGAG